MRQIIEEGLPSGSSSTPLVSAHATTAHKITVFNEWLRAITTGAFLFVAICLGLFLLQARTSLVKFDTTLDKVNTVVDSLNLEVKAIDNTRKSLDDLMVQATVLVTDADDAATKETAVLDSVNKQVTTVLTNVGNAVVALTTSQSDVATHAVQVLDQLKLSLVPIPGVLDQTKVTIASANTTIQSVNKAVNDPVVHDTAEHIDGTMTHIDGISGDAQVALHPILNPEPCKTKMCKVKRDLSSLVGASRFSEGFYYTGQVLEELFHF